MFWLALLVGGGTTFALVDGFAGAILSVVGVELITLLAVNVLLDLFIVMGATSYDHPFFAKHLLVLTQAQLPFTILLVSAAIASMWKKGSTREQSFPVFMIVAPSILFFINTAIVAVLMGLYIPGSAIGHGGVSPYIFSQYGIPNPSSGSAFGTDFAGPYWRNTYGITALLMTILAIVCGFGFTRLLQLLREKQLIKIFPT